MALETLYEPGLLTTYHMTFTASTFLLLWRLTFAYKQHFNARKRKKKYTSITLSLEEPHLDLSWRGLLRHNSSTADILQLRGAAAGLFCCC